MKRKVGSFCLQGLVALWASLWPIHAHALEPQLATLVQELKDDVYAHPAEVLDKGRRLAPKIDPERDADAWLQFTCTLAEAAGLLGDSKEVWVWLDAAAPYYDRGPRTATHVLLQSMRGVGHEFKGESSEAEKQHQKALQMARDLGDLRLEAVSSIYLAFYYNRAAEYQKLNVVVSRIHQIYRVMPKDDYYYLFMGAIGNTYSSNFTGKEDRGKDILREVVAYFQGRKLEFLAFNFSVTLIEVIGQSQPEEGIKLIEEVRRSLAMAAQPQYEAFLNLSLGQFHQRMDDCPRSLAAFEQALGYWQKQANNAHFQIKIVLGSSKCLLKLGRFTEALAGLERMEGYLAQQKLRIQFDFHELMASIHQSLNHLPEENAARRKALEIYQKYTQEQAIELTKKAEAQLGLEMMEDRQKALEAENRTQQLALENARLNQRIIGFILVLAIGLLILALQSIRSSRQLRSKQQEIQEILDTMEEGIIRIGGDLRILSNHSLHAEDLLETRDLYQQNCIDALFPPSALTLEQRSIIEQSLSVIIGGPDVAWDINSNHLPAQVTRRDRVLALSWQPVYDSHGLIRMLICSFRDISSHIQLQQTVNREIALREAFFVKLAEINEVHAARASEFILHIQDAFAAMRRQSLPQLTDRSSKSLLHTWKGTARTLGLRTLSEGLHAWEDLLAQSNADEESRSRHWEHLWADFEQYRSIAEQTHLQNIAGRDRNFLALVGEIMQPLESELLKSGIRLGTITVRQRDMIWTKERLELAHTILLHGLSNSVDHGFRRRIAELPSHRRADFEIEASFQRDEWILDLRDNGAGIDWEAIANKARAQGLELRDRQEHVDFLCRVGASTATQSSLLSGRGVGLSAIDQLCRSVEGHLEMLDNDRGSGAWLRVRLRVAELVQGTG